MNSNKLFHIYNYFRIAYILELCEKMAYHIIFQIGYDELIVK
jgi:hypothetical protein